MSSIIMNDIKNCSVPTLSTNAKLAMSYLAAHLTAISSTGTLYLLGLFDVGFLSEKSLAVKLMNYLLSTIS